MPNTIAQNLQRLQTARTNISSAITNKGIVLPENAGFENFASAIEQIEAVGQYQTFSTTNFTKITNNNRVYTDIYTSADTNSSQVYYDPIVSIIPGLLLKLKFRYSVETYMATNYYQDYRFEDVPWILPNTSCALNEYEMYSLYQEPNNGSFNGGYSYNSNGKFAIRIGIYETGSGLDHSNKGELTILILNVNKE